MFGDNIYFGLSDFITPDEVAVVNMNGEENEQKKCNIYRCCNAYGSNRSSYRLTK